MSLTAKHGLLALATLFVACNDQPTAPTPATLIVVQAPSTVGVPGWQLIDTLKVQAVDAAGHPRSGVSVTWAVNAGGGSVQVVSDTTDADGMAAALWTLGAREGLNVLRARTLDDATVEFRSTGEAFKVDRLASSPYLGCGLVGGALWCWGRGSWVKTPPASLFATTLDPAGWSSGPGLVDGAREYVDVAVSGLDACALDRQSEVWCGNGSVMGIALVAGLPPIRRLVGAGFAFAGKFCGLAVTDSTPWCWRPGSIPAQLAGAPRLSAMWMEDGSAPGFPVSACGLRSDSTAVCWGAGPLGDGTAGSSDTPVVVSGGHRFAELAAGVMSSCGRTSSTEVWCWGTGFGGPTLLVPTLMTTGAAGIAADWEAMQLIAPVGGPTIRWLRTRFSELYYPTGLTGLPVVSFANNNLSCVRLVDGQVYCYDEMWNPGWSVLVDMNYSAVQPVRPPAPDAPRR